MMTDADALAVAGAEPDLDALQQEYEYAWNQDPDATTRIANAEDVRYTRWAGQSTDGLKHQELLREGERAMPYDRAPDTRVNLADSIIQDLLDRDWMSFWNARMKIAPASASKLTLAQSGELRAVNSWMIHGPMRANLINDVEFASQVRHTIGWVVLYVNWRQKRQMRLQKLTLDSILQISRQAPPDSLLEKLPGMIKDPTQTDEVAELLRALFPNLKAGRARKVIEELRENEEAEFPTPDKGYGCPEVRVLVPWMDFIMPIESTANPEEARAMFHRQFLSEHQVRTRAAEEEWSEDFLTAILGTKGLAMENGTSTEHAVDENFQLIETVYAYAKSVDDDGVPGIYCTVISPHLRSIPVARALYGRHELCDLPHGQYPFVIIQNEVTGRRPADSRGVPDVVSTTQMEMKQQRDATFVYSQMSVTPPLQKRGTQASRLPPELGPMGIINNVGGSEWAWFPPPPGKPEIAFKLLEDVRREKEDYYGVARADMPPSRWQPRQQRIASRWLEGWGIAFWQLACLAYQNMGQEMTELLGRPPLLQAMDVARQRLLLWFDTRAMDPAWVESLLKNIGELVLPADSAGVIDRSKLVQFALAYLEPTLAEELTLDQTGARQKTYKDVRDEISAIMAGNEGLYVENDPAAKMKMDFAKQIVLSNPDYVKQLHPQSPDLNKDKRGKLDKYLANLQQNVAQQDNKLIGRLGVKPGTPT